MSIRNTRVARECGTSTHFSHRLSWSRTSMESRQRELNPRRSHTSSCYGHRRGSSQNHPLASRLRRKCPYLSKVLAGAGMGRDQLTRTLVVHEVTSAISPRVILLRASLRWPIRLEG